MMRRGQSDDDGPEWMRLPPRGVGGTAREGTDGRARSDGFRDLDVQRMTRFSTRTFRAIRLAATRPKLFSVTNRVRPRFSASMVSLFPVPTPLENRNPSREIGDDQSNCLMLLSSLMRFSM